MTVMERFSLAGKNAIVTGGATGLGYAMAEAMAQAGADIIIADINLPSAQQAAQKISQCGVNCRAVQLDVTDEPVVEQTVRALCEEYGHLDVLLNNAGICEHIDTVKMKLSNWQKVFDVNMNGVFLMAKEVGAAMIKQGGGSIVNIASMSGLVVNTPQIQCAYNASKAGVIQLTKSLATEWAPYHVRVNAIAPGYMRTPMTAPFFAGDGPMVKRWMAMSPMGRPGQPEELGGAIVYLASEASSFTTGAVLTVDGGYTCW